jgi:hypothetical protein
LNAKAPLFAGRGFYVLFLCGVGVDLL